MNTAVIITKTDPEVKRKVQAVAKELGMSVSALINAYLKQVIRERKVAFSLDEEPSDYLLNAMKEAKENVKTGNHSPTFTTSEEAISWLEKQGV